MENSHLVTKRTIPSPDWSNVRSIYKKLSDEFHILTGPFGVNLDSKTRAYLDHLIIVIDDVDQCVDELSTKESRDEITGSLISFLKGPDREWNNPLATDRMMRQMGILKEVILESKVQDEFIEAAESIFYNTEAKRHTPDLDLLIDYVLKEGEATARLPLSVIGCRDNKAFTAFFTRLCTLMGIADLIFDARSDYRSNYISVKPSLSLYLKLHRIMIREGWKLLMSFPKKRQFVSYCLRFTWALVRE